MSFQVLKKCLRKAIIVASRQGQPMPADVEIRALPLLVSSLGSTVHILPEEKRKSKCGYPREKD